MKNKKAVFFDIDGTLVDFFSGIIEIRESVATAIRKLQEDGHYIFIATGRPYAFLNEEIVNFGFDGYIVANGALVIMDNKVLYSDYMDKQFVKELVEELEKNNIEYVLETPKYTYLKEEFVNYNNFFKKAGVESPLIKSKYDMDELQVQKIEAFCTDKESVKQCISMVEANDDYGYFKSISEESYEIYLRRNTKAHAITKVLEILNIPIENSYAFGDGTNDIEMLSTVGCGIAMGNASDEVKKYADKITDTVHNDGVAVGIREYIYC